MKEYQDTYEVGYGYSATEKVVRNIPRLSEMVNCFVEDGVVTTHESTAVTIGGLATTFPFPQVIELRNVTLVCYPTAIYELVNGAEVLKINGLSSNGLWSVADFYGYIVLMNGLVTVSKDPFTLEYGVDAVLPTAGCCINLNGQLLIGAPVTIEA